jgi:ADP/ATP carrier protein family
MACLMFTILLNQNIVRGIKDNLITTMISPEILSFIKLWCEMPAGIIFVIIYSKMCNHMSAERVFRYVVLFFLSFFWFFAFVLFPNKDLLHPDPQIIANYVELYPHFKWFILIFGNWTYVLFYVFGELWPVVVFSLLFWQLANKITKTEQAGRFYSFFSFFGQSNLLISGAVILYFSSSNTILSQFFLNISDSTEIMLKSLIILVMASGAVCLALHKFIENKIINDPEHFLNSTSKNATLELSLKDTFKMLMSSRYLGLICLILLSYSMAVNLLEGLLFSKIKEAYPNPQDFMAYQGRVYFWMGVFTLIIAILGSSIIRIFGWFVGAVLTPLMILLNGSIFFSAVLLENHLTVLFALTKMTPLAFIVLIAALQNVFGKGTKYSLFDATKEMLYIPLSYEMKTKGKAAVEVVGAKLGKSSGAIIQFIIFTLMPNVKYTDIAWLLMIFFILICISWISTLGMLSKKYTALLNEKN